MIIKKFLPWVLLLLGITQIHAAVLSGIEPTYINVGTGVDTSFLVIDESDLNSSPLVFVYHYDYDINNPLTGYSLLTHVAAGSSLLPSTSLYGGGLGNSLDSLTFQTGQTVSATTSLDGSGTYWSYYVSEGQDGGVSPVLRDQWNYANYGMDFRTISPGSWDGWTLSSYSSDFTTYDFPPTVPIVAVPEPQPMLAVLISLTLTLLLVRWSRSKQSLES
jgi:hypothetical protein